MRPDLRAGEVRSACQTCGVVLPRIGHPWIDESAAPLYVWSFPRGPALVDLEACCAARERWATTARFPVAWVVDLQNLVTVGAVERRVFSEHLLRFEPHDAAWNRGSAIVADNAVLRGVVTAVFWLMPPRFPYRIFSTRAEARAWATERLAAATRQPRA